MINTSGDAMGRITSALWQNPCVLEPFKKLLVHKVLTDFCFSGSTTIHPKSLNTNSKCFNIATIRIINSKVHIYIKLCSNFTKSLETTKILLLPNSSDKIKVHKGNRGKFN